MAGRKKTKEKSPRPSKPGRARKKSAYGTGCANRDCKIRRGGCAGFEGCPGYKKA